MPGNSDQQNRFFPRSFRAGWLLCAYLLAALLQASTPTWISAQTTELSAAASLVKEGKLPEAEQKLHVYLRTHPHSARANTLLGTVYLKQGQLQQAIQALQKAVAEAPTSLEARLTLGDALLAQGKFDDAIVVYKVGVTVAPGDVRFNLALAKLHLGQGDFAKSLESVENIPLQKRTAELLPTLAADYFGLQQPEKAALEIQSMLQIADKQPDLIPELAEFFLAHRDFNSADQLLTLAKSKQPATDRFLIDVAQTQAGLGKLDDAQSTLEGVLERKPDSVEALLAAGQVASKQSNWDAAAEAFSRANNLAAGRPDILYGLVTAQLHTNQTESAAKNAESLHELAPDDLRTSYVLALALFGIGKRQDAKKPALQVLAVHPEDREMSLVLAYIALNDEHNLSAAREYVNACFKLNPGDSAALYYLGMIQKMEGDVPGAIQNFAKSVSANPKNPDAQAALGSLCLQTGNVACAVPALEQATQLAPNEAQNHYQLALAYTRAALTDKAKEQLKIYQQIKAKEEKEAKDLKGPTTSEVPAMGIGSRP